jgi:hypothetical protein
MVDEIEIPEEHKGPVKPYLEADWTEVCGTHQDKSDDWKEGFNYAMNVLGFWATFQLSIDERSNIPLPHFAIGMGKSRLLRRLIIGEELRRIPCPVHKGRMLMFDDCEQCQGTGWLPNEGDEIAALGRGSNYSDLGPFLIRVAPKKE